MTTTSEKSLAGPSGRLSGAGCVIRSFRTPSPGVSCTSRRPQSRWPVGRAAARDDSVGPPGQMISTWPENRRRLPTRRGTQTRLGGQGEDRRLLFLSNRRLSPRSASRKAAGRPSSAALSPSVPQSLELASIRQSGVGIVRRHRRGGRDRRRQLRLRLNPRRSSATPAVSHGLRRHPGPGPQRLGGRSICAAACWPWSAPGG